MDFKNRLFSNIFWRNVFASFDERSAYSQKIGDFVPYFQYKIGNYHSDYYLYFKKTPFPLRYKNEVFNKLLEYTGYDIITYLEFHYNAFSGKSQFLRFLHYELSGRIKQLERGNRCNKLQEALAWVVEQETIIRESQQDQLKQELRTGVHDIMANQPAASSGQIDNQIEILSKRVGDHMERIMSETEQGIREITGSFATGNIELTSHSHEEKLLQLFILIQQIQAPASKPKGEQLFKKISASDIAAILFLHFDAFRDTKPNTVHRKVLTETQVLHHKSKSAKKLEDALQEFFYT